MKDLQSSQKSITAIIVTGIYLLLVAGAFAVMFLANEDDSLAGIFVVLVATPWTVLLTWIIDTFSIDSMVFNTIFSALGSLLNAWIIYSVISFLSRRKTR